MHAHIITINQPKWHRNQRPKAKFIQGTPTQNAQQSKNLKKKKKSIQTQNKGLNPIHASHIHIYLYT